MSSPSTSSLPGTIPTRERLLDAAAEVFARDGLRAATTREIAHVAGVNEVTLFRLFKNKQNLLASVLERVFGEAPATFSEAEEVNGGARGLIGIIEEYVASGFKRANKNLALLRVLIGEIQHFQEHELKVIHAIFLPERKRIIKALHAAQESGEMNKEIDAAIAADQLSALVFMGAMRGAMPLPREYSSKSYLNACVAMIVQAIKVPPSKLPLEPGNAGRRKHS
ncbi:MAG: transcriptional regulator, TetR family [Chthoniobacteraceae bacterium]|nr:transcriptional regulator, TetR family [Chthoniobacteraceae bacterium]